MTQHKIMGQDLFRPASWSSGNAFVSGAEGLRFESRPSQPDTVLPGLNVTEISSANSLHA